MKFVPRAARFRQNRLGTSKSSRSISDAKNIDRQQRLDCPPVSRIPLNLNCRNETIPILRALQHVYSQPAVRDSILRAIARDVNGRSSPRRGRPGMSYWEILVLAAVRLGCNYDYDQLQDIAENHRALRQILGIGGWKSEEQDKSNILVCRCAESTKPPSRRRRQASSSAKPGSRTRASSRRLGPCSRAMGWSAVATGPKGDLHATLAWACWGEIFMCWASC